MLGRSIFLFSSREINKKGQTKRIALSDRGRCAVFGLNDPKKAVWRWKMTALFSPDKTVELFEREVEQSEFFPALKIKMPPFGWINTESVFLHDVNEHFPVVSGLVGQVVVIGGSGGTEIIEFGGHLHFEAAFLVNQAHIKCCTAVVPRSLPGSCNE